MKEETKNAVKVNSTVIALTISIIATIKGFAGGVCNHDTNIYKWIVGCGLMSSIVLYVTKVTCLEGLKTNKIVKIICVALIIIAVILFICYMAAHFSISFTIWRYPKTKPIYVYRSAFLIYDITMIFFLTNQKLLEKRMIKTIPDPSLQIQKNIYHHFY